MLGSSEINRAQGKSASCIQGSLTPQKALAQISGVSKEGNKQLSSLSVVRVPVQLKNESSVQMNTNICTGNNCKGFFLDLQRLLQKDQCSPASPITHHLQISFLAC